MAGANYMGGRRNSARTRTKDVAGRTQKGHFMKQKHQILVRGLRNNSLEGEERRPTPNGRIEDIKFAHARKDLQQNNSRTPLIQPKTPSQRLPSSSSPRSNRQHLLKRSKILEDLDVNEPTGLKATMKRILRQPDLAGLKGVNARPTAITRRRESNLTDGDTRKRQRAEEIASNSSSSSFHYDSPTRKVAFGQSQLLAQQKSIRTLLSSDDDRLYSASGVSARSSSVVAERSIADIESISFSDRVSPLQDVHSNSSYPDSGFSELQFSDAGDKYSKARQYDMDVSDIEAEDHGTRALPNSDFLPNASLPQRIIPKSREVQTPKRPTDLSSKYRIAAQLRLNESPILQELSTSCIYDAKESLQLPLTELQNSQSSPAPAISHHQTTGIEELQRFGVGYSPSNRNTDYKPFVPLTTMLPSYSEEDVVYAEDEMSNTDECMDMLMDIADADDQMDVQPIAESKSTNTGSVHRNTRTSLSPLSPQVEDHPIFQIPPRRFVTSPTRRSSTKTENRPRFTFPLQDTVSSILALDENVTDGVQNPFNSDKVAFHIEAKSPRTPTFSRFPLRFVPDNDEESIQKGVSSNRINNERLVSSIFSNSPELCAPQEFDSMMPNAEGEREVASIATHPSAGASVARNDGVHTIAAPMTSMQTSPLPDADRGLVPEITHSRKSPYLPSPVHALAEMSKVPHLFDGPNLFADEDGDDD